MKQNKNILKNPGVQSLLTSLLCILLGLFIGYLVLLLINPTGAWGAITNVMKNFLTYSSAKAQLKYLGNTLVRTAPLLMCSLSVLFVYKVGLFNIGAAGQYVAGACACLYAALYLHWHWLPCMLLAIAAGALLGVISGLLKSSFNVSEVISGIMLNWIALYITNMLLTNVKEATSPYTYQLKAEGPQAILPQISLSKLLSSNQYVTIAIPLVILVSVAVWILLEKTKLGYELRATGCNPVMSRAQGVNTGLMKVIGLALSNGVVALSGALLCQYQGYTDVNMGRGAVVIGLAAVVIGQAVLGRRGGRMAVQLGGVILGAVIYYIVYQVIIFAGFDTDLLKMFSAVVVAVFLGAPHVKAQLKAHSRSKKGDSGHAKNE